MHAPRAEERETWWDQWCLAAAAIACWLLLALGFGLDHLLAVPHSLVLICYVGAYLTGGSFAARKAFSDLRHGHANIDLLMITAAIGAATVNAWGEGAVLLGLFSSSNALEFHALERTRHAVKALMALSPEVATLLRLDLPGGEMVVPVEDLAIDDIVLIRPGERVPIDGTVLTGQSDVDQAAITGESMPVAKQAGALVFAATINGSGSLQVSVTKLSRESALAKIIGFVEAARQQKSRSQRFAERFEGPYAVGVIVAAGFVTVICWLVLGWAFGDAFYRAMTLLVVASPCALVISTPASTLSALANAAKHGILFKGGNHLEDAGAIQVIAFDKTGTLTEGKPVLTDVVPLDDEWTADILLQRTASAERLSEHSLARAIVDGASARGLTLDEATNFDAIAGKGVAARVDGRDVLIGNEALFHEFGVSTSTATAELNRLRTEGKTAMIVGDRAKVRGLVAVADTVRPHAAAAIAELKRLGINRTIMLTGDNSIVAAAIGRELGVDEVRADLLPDDKLAVIRELMKTDRVAMVGDGVNDAPALATATLGIAMGAGGTDVALETADVVLMADDLAKLPYAIALSRRTRRIIVQNLSFALGVIAVLVTATLTIGIPLPLGVVGHEGSTILVVLNGLRLLRSKSTDSDRDRWSHRAFEGAAAWFIPSTLSSISRALRRCAMS